MSTIVTTPPYYGPSTTNGATYFSSVTDFVRLSPPEPIKAAGLTPNAETAKVIKDMLAGKNVVECESADDMFHKLGI